MIYKQLAIKKVTYDKFYQACEQYIQDLDNRDDDQKPTHDEVCRRAFKYFLRNSKFYPVDNEDNFQ